MLEAIGRPTLQKREESRGALGMSDLAGRDLGRDFGALRRDADDGGDLVARRLAQQNLVHLNKEQFLAPPLRRLDDDIDLRVGDRFA